MGEELHDLVPERWDMKAARLRLRDGAVPVLPRPILLQLGVIPDPDVVELPPQADVVDLRKEVIPDRLPGKLTLASQGVLVAFFHHRPSHYVLISGGRCRGRYGWAFRVFGVVDQ